MNVSVIHLVQLESICPLFTVFIQASSGMGKIMGYSLYSKLQVFVIRFYKIQHSSIQ